MVNEGNYSKNARKNMDFIKSNNKNRYVNFFAHRNKSNNKRNENLKNEILLMSKILGEDAKIP